MKFKGTPDEIIAKMKSESPGVPDAVERAKGLTHPNKHSLSIDQAYTLFTLAQPYNKSICRILEIGTARGFSAAVLAEACPLAHITTLNPQMHETEDAKKNLRSYPNIEVVTAYSWDYLEHYIGTGYDLIFIDGDHKRVACDLPWWEHLRPGGLMLFHDYSPAGSWRECPPVFEACNQLAEERGLHEPEVVVRDTDNVGMAGFYKQGDPIKGLVSPFYAVQDARPHSILGLRQLWTMFDIAQTLRSTTGCIVECGVQNGGSALLLYEGAKRSSRPYSRDLYLFGDPAGVPEPEPELDSPKAHYRWQKQSDGWSRAINGNPTGLSTWDMKKIHYFPGLFADTFYIPEAQKIKDIALLHIDATLYRSTRQSLERFLPYMIPGGVVLVSAYGYWPGIQRAVDDTGDFPLFRYDEINVAWRVDETS